MVYRQIVLFFLLALSIESYAQATYALDSPSGAIHVRVRVDDSVYFDVRSNGIETLSQSAIALFTQNSKLGIQSKVRNIKRRSVRDTIVNPVPFKRKQIPDRFNELTVNFRQAFSIIFRAYDDGVAYRFITSFKDTIEVVNEVATFRFTRSDTVYFSEVTKRDGVDIFHTSFEEPYSKIWLESISASKLSYSPLLVDGKIKTIITESDLQDYPGMFLRGTSGKALRGAFAPSPRKEQIQGGEFRQPVVIERQSFLAKTTGSRSFPWRVMIFAAKDADLVTNDLVYRLGSAPTTQDWSWVKPGMSTEEWICGINLYNINFKAGINTETYKFYIDFANRFGMPYVMLDAGWSDYNDLFKIKPDLDLEEISLYAKTKNVGLILWTLSMTLDRQLEEALTMFNSLGVKVIMTDFMDRDDQYTVRFYQRVAEATARHRIMVMFHGAFKNAGFERTYPHAITREAVLGSEYNIWSDKATPEHDLLLPFIRMVAGPMDYEPGFYTNVNKETFRPLANLLMSQGTRCHQLAMFIAYDSPLQMFSGNPSDALQEPEYTSFLSSLPTTWDDTVVPDARMGEYLIIARKKGDDWFLAAMTDWTAREIDVDLSFLESGNFTAFICEDGTNAAKYSSDYQMRTDKVNASTKMKIIMAPGGGFAAKLIKDNGRKP